MQTSVLLVFVVEEYLTLCNQHKTVVSVLWGTLGLNVWRDSFSPSGQDAESFPMLLLCAMALLWSNFYFQKVTVHRLLHRGIY